MNYIPYTYLIGWTTINKWYYGCEWKTTKNKQAHPNNLWKTYFTSSKIVEQIREQHGEPDVVKVRRHFNTSDAARRWERIVLRRLDAGPSSKWLNLNNGIPERKTFVCSEETKRKISNTHHLNEKNKGVLNPNYGKCGELSPKYGTTHSPNTIAKMKESAKCGEANWMFGRTGELSPNYGRIVTDETRSKLREARAANKSTRKNTHKTYIGTNLHTNEQLQITGMRKFASERNLSYSCCMDACHGRQSNHKGWVFELA